MQDVAHDIESPEMAGAKRQALRLIAGFLVLRLVVSWVFPATVDESYAIAVSRGWSLSYFDHPPVGFTLAHLMAWLSGTESTFVVRLPFIFAGAVSAWLVWDITRLAYGEKAAFWALAWFSVAPFFFISAGHFIVPDGPLNLGLLATLRLVLPDLLAPGRRLHAGRWFAAGVFFALALASKYQAVLFGVSALAFLLASPPHRRLFASPVLWATLAIALLGLVPTLVWNAQNGWISFAFQSGRAGAGTPGLQLRNLASTALGQMLYLLPGTWIVIMVTATCGILRPVTVADRLFAWFAILPPALFLAIALVSRNSLPHWAMSGFLFGFPLAGRWTARALPRYSRAIRLSWRASALGIPLLALLVGLQTGAGLFTRPFYDAAPRWDFDWQMTDWTALREAWPQLGAPGAVVVRNWVTGAKAGHALGPDVAVFPIQDPRHFQYLATGSPAKAIAVHAARPHETEDVLRWFPALLTSNGYRLAEEPRVLRQMAGNQIRFVIVAIPVERAE
ncbi:MAG: glycosyltransferase family 39 protein [Oricola sp.]